MPLITDCRFLPVPCQRFYLRHNRYLHMRLSIIHVLRKVRRREQMWLNPVCFVCRYRSTALAAWIILPRFSSSVSILLFVSLFVCRSYYPEFPARESIQCDNATDHYNRGGVNHSGPPVFSAHTLFTTLCSSSIILCRLLSSWGMAHRRHVEWCTRVFRQRKCSDSYTHTHTFRILAVCCKLASGSWSRIERGQTQSCLSSLTLSQRGEATVGNMNYEMIRGCKMEINPGDYTAQYLTIQFLCQWFLIVDVWRTASLIMPHVWHTAGGSIVVMEFLWAWLRRQLHFAFYFQDVFLFFI